MNSIPANHTENSSSEHGGICPPFPNVLKGVAGAFAIIYSSYLEVPAHFFFMGFLTCLGSFLSNSLTLASEISPQPRLYTLLLGESADDRKSTALTKVIDFFHSAVPGFQVCWGIGSAEGLQKRLADSSQLVLCFDEFKQFVSKCRIDASVLLPCVNSLFESTRYESVTKKTRIFFEDVRLSMLAASTIQTYERTWHPSFTDIGFNNRIFLVPGSGERRFSFPAKVPERDLLGLRQYLGQVLGHVGTRLELDITPAARAIYHEWYMNLKGSIHAKRLDVYAMRLMSLLAVNELKREVDEETVRQAIALSDWQLKVRQLYDPVDADNKVARLEESIRRVLSQGPRSDRDLKRYCHAHRAGLWFYNAAMNNLMRADEIRKTLGTNCWELIQG